MTLMLSLSVGYVYSQSLTPALNMALEGLKSSKGLEVDRLGSAVSQEIWAQDAVNTYERNLSDKLTDYMYKNDEYFYMLEWLDSAINNRDVAHSNYLYALTMLEQLSSSSQTDPAAIMYWENKRDTAYRNRSSAEADIAMLTPQVEEARVAANEAIRKYNEYWKEVELPLSNARAEVTNARLAIRGHVDNIIVYIDNMIGVYESYNKPELTKKAIDALKSEKQHYKTSYSSY